MRKLILLFLTCFAASAVSASDDSSDPQVCMKRCIKENLDRPTCEKICYRKK